MSRMVPAIPRVQTAAEIEALEALETGLNDDFIIFQSIPKPGVMIIAHPDQGACLLICTQGLQTYDADADDWGIEDTDSLIDLASIYISVPMPVISFLPHTPPPRSPKSTMFFGPSSELPRLVQDAIQKSSSIGDEGIQKILQSISPGATPYSRGTVTTRQTSWRESRRTPTATPDELSSTVTINDRTETVVSTDEKKTKQVFIPKNDAVNDAHPIITMLRQAAENVAKGKQIFLSGVQIEPSELAGVDMLLPSLLLAAAQDWAPVVASKDGKGGFHVRLISDNNALLGYKVVGITPSAPLLLVLPVANRIRRALKVNAKGKEEFIMDETVYRFKRWLETNKFNTDAINEVDLRIATSIG
jgi:hypothetical protein